MRSISTPVNPEIYLRGPNSLVDVELVLIARILFSIEKIESLITSILADNFSFDLYIHDQWAGYGNNPPDYWGIFIDKQRFFYTTFSNTLNGAQSYPKHEGYLFPPASDAIEKLPGLYTLKSRADGTAMYHVVWSIAHDRSFFELALSDLVAESNVSIKSWSIDNLKVVCTNIE
jgi:hypothetical protein